MQVRWEDLRYVEADGLSFAYPYLRPVQRVPYQGPDPLVYLVQQPLRMRSSSMEPYVSCDNPDGHTGFLVPKKVTRASHKVEREHLHKSNNTFTLLNCFRYAYQYT
jgi:hypothetical protein